MKELIQAINDGDNILLTGGAGVGKTYHSNIIIDHMLKLKRKFAVCALTGLASQHLHFGMTIHRFLGIGNKTSIHDLHSLESDDVFMKNVTSIIDVSAILIDEVSMMRGDLFELVDGVLKLMRRIKEARDGVVFSGKENEPFGGYQIILVGDFCQLPPVVRKDESVPCKWIFQHRLFLEAKFRVYNLLEVKRTDDLKLATMYNKIRIGYLDKESEEIITSRAMAPSTLDATVLMSRVNSVKDYNEKRLNSEIGHPITLNGIVSIREEIKEEGDSDKIKMLYRISIAESGLTKDIPVKMGCRVMLLANNPQMDYSNGSQGVLINMKQFDEHNHCFIDSTGNCIELDFKYFGECLIVRLDDGREVVVPRKAFNVYGSGFDEKGKRLIDATFYQYPIVLGYAISIHKCINKNSIIQTSKGLLNFDEIINEYGVSDKFKENIDTELKGFNIAIEGINGEKRTSEIFTKKDVSTLIMTTKRGYELEATLNHPILTVSDTGSWKWKKYSELMVGDKLLIKKNYSVGNKVNPSMLKKRSGIHQSQNTAQIPSEINPDVAWLLGAIVGDGSYNDKKEYSIQISKPCMTFLNEIKRITFDNFKVEAKIYKGKGVKCNRLFIMNKSLRECFLDMGLDYTKSKDKKVPLFIKKCDNEIIKSFIQGLFDTDGGINKTIIHFTTTSNHLSKFVSNFLLSIGIVSSFKKMQNGATRVYMTGHDSVLFMEKIGFRHVSKKADWEKFGHDKRKGLFPKSNVSHIPNTINTIVKVRDALRGVKCNPKMRSLLSRIINSTCNLSTYHIDSINALLADKNVPEWQELLRYRNFYIDEIGSLEKSRCDVFDFCVPDGHDFISNGIVSHNSQGMSLDNMILDCAQIFAEGQFYVGISRARSIGGISLLNFNKHYLKADHAAVDFYLRIASLEKGAIYEG